MAKSGAKKCTVCLGITFPLCFIAGVVFIITGIILLVQFPSIIEDQVNKKVTVEKGHATYEQLEEPSIPIYKDFYFFNLTNYQQFHDERGGVLPDFEEIGPYSFSEIRTKTLVETENQTELNYTQQKIYFFSESTSGEDLEDTDIICTINIPLIGAINLTKNESFARAGLKAIIDGTNTTLYVCQPATDLIWGYTDPFIKALYDFELYPLDYVFLQVNDSIEDSYTSTINTGIPDITQVGQFIRWNGRTQLDIWQEGSEANELRGTEGFFFRPYLRGGDRLTAFVDDIVRSIDILYEGKVNQLGVSAFRYGIDNTTFKGASTEPKNAQYFSWCPDGMFFLGPTQVVEVPVYGSKPHFLDGDPLLLESVVGLEPNREEHDTVIDIEPITGANVNFQRKLQVVVQVNRTEKYEPHDTIAIVENIMGYNDSGVLYFPVLYLNEHATIDDDFKEYLEGKGLALIKRLQTVGPTVFALLIFIGVVLLLVGFLALFVWTKRTKRGTQIEKIPLIHNDKEGHDKFT